MALGFKISLEGIDALGNIDINNFSLWLRDLDTDPSVLIKEKTRGSGTLSYGGDNAIAHGLGYIPMVFVWGESSDGNIVMQGTPNVLTASEEWQVEMDSTNITITQLVNAGDFDYYYYIFYDKLE